MSGVNRGKQFEAQIERGFESVPGCSVDRLHDQTNGFAGSSNICDYIVYKHPTEFYIECKSCHGNTLSIYSNDPKKKYGAISNKQWEGLLEKSQIQGVVAGYIVWFIDHDITIFVKSAELKRLRDSGSKSLNIKDVYSDKLNNGEWCYIEGKKKRVLFDYNLSPFLERWCV